MKRARTFVLVLVLASTPVSGNTQSSDYELAQKVAARQALMFDMLSAYWPMEDVRNGKSRDFAAAEVAALSVPPKMDEFLLLMTPGTAKGEAPGSRARPEVWAEWPEFLAAASELQSSTLALADAAKTEDAALFSAAFDAFAASCVGCHGFRPSADGRFRFQE